MTYENAARGFAGCLGAHSAIESAPNPRVPEATRLADEQIDDRAHATRLHPAPSALTSRVRGRVLVQRPRGDRAISLDRPSVPNMREVVVRQRLMRAVAPRRGHAVGTYVVSFSTYVVLLTVHASRSARCRRARCSRADPGTRRLVVQSRRA